MTVSDLCAFGIEFGAKRTEIRDSIVRLTSFGYVPRVCDLPNCVQAGPEQAVLYANVYAHVYALLYAGVVAAGTCTAPAAGRYAALPDEPGTEPNRREREGSVAGGTMPASQAMAWSRAVRTRALVTRQN